MTGTPGVGSNPYNLYTLTTHYCHDVTGEPDVDHRPPLRLAIVSYSRLRLPNQPVGCGGLVVRVKRGSGGWVEVGGDLAITLLRLGFACQPTVNRMALVRSTLAA